MNVPLEKHEAEAFVKMMQYRNIQHWHIPNENSIRSPQYLSSMKRQGWNKGISDYFILLTPERTLNGKMCGLFIELKRQRRYSAKTGKELKLVSTIYPEQELFIDNINMIHGVQGKICYGADEAIEFVDSFLKF